MNDAESGGRFSLSRSRNPILSLVVAVGIVYFFSNPKPQNYYDYTFRVAANILQGSIGFAEKQPSWLNEFVLFGGQYYSVFPLGAVISMMPFAVFRAAGLISEMPAALIGALLAASTCFFLLLISMRYEIDRPQRLLIVLAIPFGTWTWVNLTMAGAWQLALGFAMLGELGAIYFTVFDRRPLIAGICFAIAFGNRTEIVLTAPVYYYLLSRSKVSTENSNSENLYTRLHSTPVIQAFVLFSIIPFLLGISTLGYNYVRFGSPFDFGYARIPGVLQEPWYNHGIFSVYYIPRQAWEMLWKPWNLLSGFPYVVPNGFGNSILWSSPFLLFAFRTGGRDRILKYCAWASIILMTVVLWMHGNSGGWQFGYRYAMILLPWLFVILLETAPKKINLLEWAAYGFSFTANLFALWLFHWTEYVKP